jgi:hypothetical protein
MSDERTALIVAQRPSDYVEMRRCAVALHQRGWRVVMAYHCIYLDRANEQGIIDDIEALGAAGVLAGSRIFAILQRSARPAAPAAPPGRVTWTTPIWLAIHRTKARLLRRPRAIARDAAIFLYNVRTYRQRLPEYDALMRQWRPDAMILPEDVVGLVTPLIIRAGQRNGVPSLILPYTIANQQEAFQSLKSNPSYRLSHWANFLCGLIWSRWVMRKDGHALIRLPAPHVIAHALTRVAPPDPWMMNSGFANAIAVENEAMLDYYRQAGIPAGKMHVVGAIYDDYLARFLLTKEQALAELRAELALASSLPLLVVGGCPDQTGNCPPGFEFADMAEFGGRLAEALRPLADSYQILFRPHPNFLDLSRTMECAGIRTTTVDTARLVAMSDLYVAFGSATIRWAIACAVPTVNYDVFHYAYGDFAAVDGVINVDSYAEFAARLAELVPGAAAFEGLRTAIKRAAGRWGMLDGRSVDRIVALLEQLRAVKPVPRTSA